jgi:hypothetical protein
VKGWWPITEEKSTKRFLSGKVREETGLYTMLMDPYMTVQA